MYGFGSMLKDYLEYNKISQTDFADRLGITQKHMNEIINGKTNLSIDLILGISLLTDIDANLIYYAENKKKTYEYLINKYKDEKSINNMLNSYYLKDMVKMNWIKLKDSSSFTQNYMDLLEYMNIKNIDMVDNYLSNRFLFKKSSNEVDNKKIFLWIKHCDTIAKNIEVSDYNSNRLNDLLLELKTERMKKFSKNKLTEILKKYGIILVIEDALKGSKIRGCVKVMNHTPVIYMTTYLKEKSSFYYTLYHEIMHIKKDYNKLKNKTIIDEDENEIDILALNEMINEKVYNQILNDFDNKDKIAKENNIPLCFLYSRLAKESKIKYTSKEYRNHIEKI